MLICFVFAFVILHWRRTFGKRGWATAIVLALVFSLFLAYFSLSNVWVPHALSDDVLYQEERAHGEFEGLFPWSKLSYPLSLSVVHTPFSQLTFQYPYAHGQVRFTVFFAGTNMTQINGAFWYYYPVMGPMPLQYKIDFVFSPPLQFFGFLLVSFTLFDFVGALLGISLAYFTEKRLFKRVPRSPIVEVNENLKGRRMDLGKPTALILIPIVFLYFYSLLTIWNALLSSFNSTTGGWENMILSLFILWIALGILACLFLGALAATILRKRRSKK